MAGQGPLDLALDRLPNTALVNDIVYAPLETRAARGRQGARQPDGRRARHAAASGAAGLRRLVRRRPAGDAGLARPSCSAELTRHASSSASPARSAWARARRPQCCAAWACRCTTPTRRCIVCSAGRRGGGAKCEAAFPDVVKDGAVDRQALGASGVRRSRRARRASKPSSIRWCGASARQFLPRRRAPACAARGARHPAAVRSRMATAVATRPSW